MSAPNTLAQAWSSAHVDRVAAPLREQVISALRAAILDFTLRPGQRLVERELIEQLGVSRTTIREALRELTSEGLVTVVPQRGAIVSAPSLAEAEDLYDIRAVLESVLVERFVERATDEQIARLHDAVEYFAVTTAGTAEIRVVLDAKDKLYEVLIEGAGSPALTNIIEGIQARVRILRATSMSEPGRAEEAAEELRSMAAAADRRDASEAARLCATHVRNASKTALKHLREAEKSPAFD
ncbi:GntR family transcriptional regulator [Herbiconiux moechotypicola]|uniref:GntR family transcriptional regulator n=1 Tax=Herbiconiux moechotypicola TaxID=637393 RepID=A0ABP5QTA2_9MICO|nr:GntR family transcriptional regulator [Herbiconiux moechotypicola]MCS5730811.1 GntR family transcriptional regulator [Herbiconiux moechotypicola]